MCRKSEITNDSMIAKFMGIEYDLYEQLRLNYRRSWNDLMPVVSEISKLHDDNFKYDPIEIAKGNFPDDDMYMNVIALPLSTPIDDAYKAVVEFVNWFNAK